MRWLLTDHICRLEEATELFNRKIPKAKRRLESVLGTFETSPKRSKVLGSASVTLAREDGKYSRAHKVVLLTSDQTVIDPGIWR